MDDGKDTGKDDGKTPANPSTPADPAKPAGATPTAVKPAQSRPANAASDTAKASKSPKTSDIANTFGWAGAFAAGLTAIGATLFARKKERMNNIAENKVFTVFFRLYK